MPKKVTNEVRGEISEIPRADAPTSADRIVVVVATGWGPSFGGINAFNLDFCLALGRLVRGSARAICITSPIDDLTRASVADRGVELIRLPQTIFNRPADAVQAACTTLRANRVERIDLTIGHDVYTGPIAIALRARSEGLPQSFTI